MAKKDRLIEFPLDNGQIFKMIDVGHKRPTRRRAVASGSIKMSKVAFEAVKNRTLPKGDVLALAESSGIMGAKNASNMLVMCHPLPLDQVTIHSVLNEDDYSLTIYCQSVVFAKTGVEMESLAGVNAALLTIWDLVKGIEPNLEIRNTKLLVKTGGKSGVWINPEGIPKWLEDQLPRADFFKDIKAAVVVMSDRASKGDYEDISGSLIKDLLQDSGAALLDYRLVPDDKEAIEKNIKDICRNHKPDILITSGGTGPGPRDITPEALENICERMLNGFGDMLRTESLYFTDTAWLSRMTAGMCGSSLIIAFPGSPKAVKECWDIISPFIGDALRKIKKQGFEVSK